MLKQVVHRIVRLFFARSGSLSTVVDARSGKGSGCSQILGADRTGGVRVQPVNDVDGPARRGPGRRDRDPLADMLRAARSR